MVIALLLGGAASGVAHIQAPVTLSAGASSSSATTEAPELGVGGGVGGGEGVGVPVDTTVVATPTDAGADDAPPTTTRTAGPWTSTKPARPSSSSGTTFPGSPVGGNHRDQPRGPGQVGSVADLGPGPVERTVPGPCTPSSQSTPPHAIAAVEVRQGCVRALVAAGTHVGSEVSWNPEGTWLTANVGGRVVRLARDGSWRQDLGGGDQVRHVVLSPDGSRMAVVGKVPFGNLSQKDVVVVAAADGTGAQVLDGRAVRAPSWSPDSQVFGLVTNPGGAQVPDVLHVVGRDGRVRASRTFTGRAIGGVAGTELGPIAAPLGRPAFLPDGRIFEPASIEVPDRASGLWLNQSLAEVGGPQPADDLLFADPLSVPADGSSIAYTGHRGAGLEGTLVRRFDLRSGATVTLGEGAAPASSHRSGAVAFVLRDPSGTPRGFSVADAGGAVRPVWRHSGTSCMCAPSATAAWTADDSALGAVGKGG